MRTIDIRRQGKIMLIGISGELESGKSSIAKILVDKYNFTELSFALNLKKMCMQVFNLTAEQVFTTHGKKTLLDNKIHLTEHYCNQMAKWFSSVNGIPYAKINMDRMISYIGLMSFTTPREVLQLIGTEVCRECVSLNYHIDVVFNEIRNRKLINVCVSDARFLNERKSINSNNGFNILVIDATSDLVLNKSNHKSETSLGHQDDYDAVIHNSKDGFQLLESQVASVFNKLNSL